MIKININRVVYNLPTSWNDVTYSKFCEIVTYDGDENGFLSIISGIPCNTLENIGNDGIQMLVDLFTFVKNFEILDSYLTNEDANLGLIKFDIGRKPWSKIEKVKQEIANSSLFICSAGEIIKVYLEKDISKEPITKCWFEVNLFLKKVNEFFEKYKRLSEYEEEEDEYIAGVDRFKQFGFLSQCIELSRKMGKSYDEVLSMSATQIYQTFLYDFEKSDYEKTLYKLRLNKK